MFSFVTSSIPGTRRLLVDRNIKFRVNAPMVRREGLSSGHFLDSGKTKTNRFDLRRVARSEVKTIETSSGFETAGKLK